jgi:hypothetical protein
MNRELDPADGSFEAAEMHRLRMALRSSYTERLQDLQDMLDFSTAAEAANPRLRWIAAQLRQKGRTA